MAHSWAGVKANGDRTSVSRRSAEEGAVKQVQRRGDRSVRRRLRSEEERLTRMKQRGIRRRAMRIGRDAAHFARLVDSRRARFGTRARGARYHHDRVGGRDRRHRALRREPQREASEQHAKRARHSPALTAHPRSLSSPSTHATRGATRSRREVAAGAGRAVLVRWGRRAYPRRHRQWRIAESTSSCVRRSTFSLSS